YSSPGCRMFRKTGSADCDDSGSLRSSSPLLPEYQPLLCSLPGCDWKVRFFRSFRFLQVGSVLSPISVHPSDCGSSRNPCNLCPEVQRSSHKELSLHSQPQDPHTEA